MKEYLDALRSVLSEGERRTNRTGIDTISKFGLNLKIDLTKGFPLLTTKKIFFKGIIGELVWFLHGDTNIKFLQENGIHIWDAWADEKGNLGPVYGKQWRDWDGVDQIATVVRQLKEDPYSRRIILSNWNVGQLSKMALPPCHILAQFYVRGNFLDCSVYQRSADMFLGVPFDIASYAALIHLLCHLCDYKPGILYYNFGDAHIYVNHIEQVKEQLSRTPKRLPQLDIKDRAQLDSISINDFILSGYNPEPAIRGAVAI